jgi:uncharacterized repeat protein (TIGR04138 family)
MGFFEKLDKIIRKDPRYARAAYEFVLEALNFTRKRLKRHGHVSGRELLEGIKDYAIEQFGPMVRFVFEEWGIRTTKDFGNIVFNMVESGVLNKTDEDSPEDFAEVYDFEEVFNQE